MKITKVALALFIAMLYLAIAPAQASASECVYGNVAYEGPVGSMPVPNAFMQVTGFIGTYRQQGAWGSSDPYGFFFLCVEGRLGNGGYDTLEVQAWGFDSFRLTIPPVNPGDSFVYVGVLTLQEPLAQVQTSGSVVNGRFNATFTVTGNQHLAPGPHPVVAQVISQGPGEHQTYSQVSQHWARKLRRLRTFEVSASVIISPNTLRGEYLCHWLAVNPASPGNTLGQLNSSTGICIAWDAGPTPPIMAFQSPDELATFKRDPIEFARRREVASRGVDAMKADLGY